MVKIIGNTTATPNPRPDWNQTDETKADYIKNKPVVGDIFEASVEDGVLMLRQSDAMCAKGDRGEKGDQGEKGDPTDVVQKTGGSTTSVMSQKAVTDTFNEFTETKLGNNLLNMATVEDGYYMGLNGNRGSNTVYFLTDYMPVTEGEAFYFYRYRESWNDNVSIRFVTAFNANKEVLTDLGAENAKPYTVPAGVAFVRFSLQKPNAEIKEYTYMLTHSPTVIPYEEYTAKRMIKAEALPKDDAPEGIIPEEAVPWLGEKKQINYLDISTKQTGILHTNGRIYTGGSYDAYRYFENYIPVSEGEVLSVQYKKDGSVYSDASIMRAVAYDANKNVLSALGKDYVSGDPDTYTVPAGVAFVRITLSAHIDDYNWTEVMVVKNADGILPYAEFGVAQFVIKPECIPAKNSILVFLPDEIVCAVGRTIEIYNNQVCPLAEKYHIQWNCNIGKALKRKFSVTGTSALVGEHSLTLAIFNDNLETVFFKTVKIKIVNALSAAKSICPIGDSLTNGKYWLNEVRNLSSNIVSYVGTRGSAEGLKHEGRSGFSSASYLSATSYSYENEGVHPFWDATNSKFSWEHYKTSTGLSPDAVQIFLGTNDFAGGRSAEDFAANVKQMVDSIRENDASIPIFLALTICWGNQNGIGGQTSSDGFQSQKGRFKYDLDCKTINGVKTLYEALKSYANVHFIPLTQCHDSEYNFGAVETPVNPRATQTELMPTEGVHPQKQGYEQMADVMYSVYCQVFNG